MDWRQLQDHIQWVTYKDGDTYGSRSTVIAVGGSWGIEVGQPGVHWDKTYEPGGDYVIRVTSKAAKWAARAFTHIELFDDIDEKRRHGSTYMKEVLMPALVGVVAEGRDPLTFGERIKAPEQLPGLEPEALLIASQCLALCEHRRFREYEPGGGRCLPTRFALGIVWGHWSAATAGGVVKQGIRGLNRLRREHGREPSFQQVVGGRLADPCCNEPR